MVTPWVGKFTKKRVFWVWLVPGFACIIETVLLGFQTPLLRFIYNFHTRYVVDTPWVVLNDHP
jgi:hypothetical protein